MTRVVTVLVALAACGVSACRGHVVLDTPPPPDAPLAERAAAYEQLKPKALLAAPLGSAWRGGHSLVLGDGTHVDDPTDLAAPLLPSSRTAAHAARQDELETASLWLRAGGLVTSVIMTSAMIYGLVQVSRRDESGGAWIGGAGVVGSVLQIGVISSAMALDAEAERERIAAFYAYPGDLRERLALVKKRAPLVERWRDDARPPLDVGAGE